LALSVIFTEKASDGMNLRLELRPEIEKWEIICPNPAIADAMRNSLSRYQGLNEFETLTINKFLQDLFQRFYPEVSVVRKSHLLKYLATIWKNIYPNERESYFHQAFNVFTDLRSFTLNPLLIEDILEHYHEVVAGAIRYFWKIVESENLIDEHQAYQNILEAISNPEYQNQSTLFNKGIIFIGFTHLSGNQVELLKFIGKYTDVVIPIPAEVMREALRTDWVDWVKTQADTLFEAEPFIYQNKIKKYNFSRGQGNFIFKNIFASEGEGNIIFTKSGIGMKEVLEIPTRNSFFKSDLDLFNSLLKNELEEIEIKFFKNIGDTVASDEVLTFLEEKSRELIFKPNKVLKDFLYIKLLGSINKEIKDWTDLSVVNEVLTTFDLGIIREMVLLNLPRSFNIPLLENSESSILSLKDIFQVDLNEKNYIYVDSGHDLSMGGATQYPKDVQEILLSLGPMRRKGLDLLFYISQIKEILSSENTVLLLESGLEEHDSTWNHILKTFEVESLTISQQKKNQERYEDEINLELVKEIDKLSPTRMQSYLECPRKYYYQYILKLGREPEWISTVDSRLLGDLEHRVVQTFLKEEVIWDESQFEKILDETLQDLPSHYKEVKSIFDEIYAEVRFYTKQSIFELLKIRQVIPDIEFEIEWQMENSNARGSADVIGFSQKMGPVLLDLKRSSGSIPDKKEIEDIKKIQLWYYLLFSFKERDLAENFSLMGYINLSDPDKSIVYYQDLDFAKDLEGTGFLSNEALMTLKDTPDTYLDKFKNLYESTIYKINKEKNFEINPESAMSCNFCPGAAICSRKVKGAL